MGDLAGPEVLDDVLYRLSYKLDGTPAAGDTYKRRRRVLNTAVEHAVVAGELPEDPLQRVRRKHVGSTEVVERRVLMNAKQARQLLTAVSYVGSWDRCRGRRLVTFYAVLYYAGLRPAEAVGLRWSDCHLPGDGLGHAHAAGDTPRVRQTVDRLGRAARPESAGGDQRPPGARPGCLLRAHLKEFGTAKAGRVFGNERGGVVGSSTYWRVLEEAREYVLPPERADSPLAGRPYDLRHACITRWLNAGVPIAEVARRVGNSSEAIHRRSHGCIDCHEEAANAKIAKVLEEEGDAV